MSIAALGDIGYDAAVPYLTRLAIAPEFPKPSTPQPATPSSTSARLNPSSSTLPISSITWPKKSITSIPTSSPRVTRSPTSGSGTTIAGSLSSMSPRPSSTMSCPCGAANTPSSSDPSKGAAVGLWLAANSKREADLPADASDPTHRGIPDAHYYNVSAGVQYLNDALSRAIRDRNAGVALKLTQALRDIIGQSNATFGINDPITQALYFPNRQVRYEAAFGLAAALPSRAFPGSDRVVPLLVEAMSQGSKPNVVVVAPDKDDLLAAIRDSVHGLGYSVVGGSDPTEAANASMVLPAVDIIIITDDSDVRRMVELEQSTSHLQGAVDHRSDQGRK